jgi:hypothetical protein
MNSSIQGSLSNKEVLDLLDKIREEVEDNPEAVEMLAFVRIGNDYHRYSSGFEDIMKLIGALEIAKHDCIQRMQN